MTITLLLQRLSELATFLGLPVLVLQIRGGNKRMRREATLEYARQTLDSRHKDWDALPDDYDQRQIADFVSDCIYEDKTSQKLESALGYLNFMETLCIGAKMGIYDNRTVYRLYGTRIIRVTEYYSFLIKWRRKTTNNCDVYAGLQKGAKRYIRMKKRRSFMNRWRALTHSHSRSDSQPDDKRAAD